MPDISCEAAMLRCQSCGINKVSARILVRSLDGRESAPGQCSHKIAGLVGKGQGKKGRERTRKRKGEREGREDKKRGEDRSNSLSAHFFVSDASCRQ